MYHLTYDWTEESLIVQPRVSYRFAECDETLTPRICVAPTVWQAMFSIECDAASMSKAIYETDEETVPCDETVYDREITDEHWILKPAKFTKVKLIDFSDLPFYSAYSQPREAKIIIKKYLRDKFGPTIF